VPDERPTAVDELHAIRAAAFDWRLSRGDVAVYVVLLQHLNFRTGESWPGATRIGAIANLAMSNVKASLRRLEELRYIAVIRPGQRIANRYEILESPKVPSRKLVRMMEQTRRDLGMPATPALGMRAGPDSSKRRTPSGDAGRSSSGYADRPHLGMRAGHELAFELSSELSSASPASNSPNSEERQREEFDDAA